MKDSSTHDGGWLVESDAGWPTFVESWPETRMEFDGLRGWALKHERGFAIFMAADRDVRIPMHHHGAQWGIVLQGEMELTVADQTRVYRRGEAHFIPEGVDHEALLRAGWRGLYLFRRWPERGFADGGP